MVTDVRSVTRLPQTSKIGRLYIFSAQNQTKIRTQREPMTLTEAFADLHDSMRAKCPLVHNITNYVTVNDVANSLLAVGGSPVMADAIEEAGDMAAISSAVVINMGTLNAHTVDSMVAAGKRANAAGIPVIFDPVGAGATPYRNETAAMLLAEVKFAIIRGNLSEISFVSGHAVQTKGVDSGESDQSPKEVAVKLAKAQGCTVVVTGKTDYVSNGTRVAEIDNGVALLSKITGTGCMSSAITGAYAGATNDYFLAGIAGVASMGIAGELAFEAAGKVGLGSFRAAIIDGLSNLNREVILSRAKIRETNA